MANKRILIIDDDLEIFHAFKTVLSSEEKVVEKEITRLIRRAPRTEEQDEIRRFDLTYASQGEEGFALVNESLEKGEPFAVAFIDVRMPPGWDGVKTATLIRDKDPNIEIVIVTAFSDRSQDEILKSVGTPEKLLFFKKPFDLDEVLQLAISLTEKWNITTQEKKMKVELQSSHERFRNLVEAISDWVYELDTVGNFTYCSPVCEAMYGYESTELLGKNYCHLLTEEEHKYFKICLENCLVAKLGVQTIERHCRKKNGKLVEVESSFGPIWDENHIVVGFRGIDRDITIRKKEEEQRLRMEDQIVQVQKLEALGSLAGGIAHDFNNILSPILGFSQLCMMNMAKEDKSYQYVEYIELSARKATDLVRQILSFAGNNKTIFRPIKLNDLINDFSKMLKRLIPENISLFFDLDEELGCLRGDKCQVEQVLLNLVVNARDSFSGRNGEIRIATRNAEVNSEDSLVDINGKPIIGSFVVMSLTDNGSGIPPEAIDKIFDPFFTTKAVGKGTGIGLATIAGIVTQYKGHIRLETALNKGTSFHIYLPTIAEGDDFAAELEGLPVDIGGSGTILLAEDDFSVRAVVSSVLGDHGYKVIEAKSGSEAIEVFKEKHAEIDLLITDIVMPGYSGVELAGLVRRSVPELPVIFVSGYPMDLLPADVSNTVNTIFLAKPCRPRDILEKTRESLLRKGTKA